MRNVTTNMDRKSFGVDHNKTSVSRPATPDRHVNSVPNVRGVMIYSGHETN